LKIEITINGKREEAETVEKSLMKIKIQRKIPMKEET